MADAAGGAPCYLGIHELFTLTETGSVHRARGVSARTDTLVSVVNGTGGVGELPLH